MNDYIRELLDKQLDGSITDEEQEKLATMMDGLSDEELISLHSQAWDEFHTDVKLSDERSEAILRRIKHPSYRTMYIRIASIAAIMLMIVGVATYLFRPMTNNYELAEMQVPPYSQPVNYIRHITLSDGSTVVLKSGSRLFTSHNPREVSLDGEAYFDIIHNPQRHFIIHTGHITTTVLGTAFNIQAKNGNVTVSVTRGRVKVANGNKTLAILGVNDEIRCLADNSYTTSQNTNTTRKVELWTHEGMTFDHRTMADITRSVGTRYGVSISITSSRIANAKVYVSFSGTESLEEVMTTLSNLLPDMKYSIHGKNVTIKGK